MVNFSANELNISLTLYCILICMSIDVGAKPMITNNGNYLFYIKADVIVSSVSNNLDLMKGRASKALLKAAGEELQEQCRDNYPDGLDNDEIAVLNPGNLNCKKVYLVSLMKWTGDTEEKVHLFCY